jgi:dTDP-L-rhamnose 4-epimerase
MLILITGGAGFIGSHTARILAGAGHTVRILDRLDPQIHGADADFPESLTRAGIECRPGDVRSEKDLAPALEGVDAVYHLAAFTGVGQSMYSLASYTDTNCTGTAHLLEQLIKRRNPIRRLVLASSRAVYGEGAYRCIQHGIVFPGARRREDLERGCFDALCPACGKAVDPIATNEECNATPLSMYAWTKKQQEEQCRMAAAAFGVPVTILRYFNVYGAGQSLRNPYTGIISIFYNRLMSGQPISLYEHGGPRRDFVHVSDVARANLLALEADVKPGTCINVGSGAETTIRQAATALARACLCDARLEDKGEFRIGDIRSCYADLSRAESLLAYRPTMGLEEGLTEFVAWANGRAGTDNYQKTVDELLRHGLMGRAKSPVLELSPTASLG